MAWVIGLSKGLEAVGSLREGRYRSNQLAGEARTVQNQALRDEEMQRREGRDVLGRQAAAMAQAGGGQDMGVLKQSAALAELDALNIRYAGQAKAFDLLTESKHVRKQSKWMAATSLLGGASQAYAYKTS